MSSSRVSQLCGYELSYWLVIRRCPGLGPRRFAALLNQEKTLSHCFNGTQPRRDFIEWCERHAIPKFEPDWQGVEKDLNWASQPEQVILTWQDDHYPLALREIASAPPLLFVQGALPALTCPQIALVGSRHPSKEGKENAYHFGYELAKHGFAITSGLAKGIDTAGHEGALAAEGITLAVLGNSLDQIYPPQNRKLASAIRAKGALISEFPLGTPPKPEHFPQRNRIISGLSVGTLIVESAIKSGSLITANYAVEQGKEVFAIPGSIHNPLAKGCHQLIRQGAKCVESVEHILEELSMVVQVAQPVQPIVTLPQITDEEAQLLKCMQTEATAIDLLIEKTGLTAEVVSSILLNLELVGLVAAVPGGYLRRSRIPHERKYG